MFCSSWRVCLWCFALLELISTGNIPVDTSHPLASGPRYQVINRPGAGGGLLAFSSGFDLMITSDILQRGVNLGGLLSQSRVGGRVATSTFQHSSAFTSNFQRPIKPLTKTMISRAKF